MMRNEWQNMLENTHTHTHDRTTSQNRTKNLIKYTLDVRHERRLSL